MNDPDETPDFVKITIRLNRRDLDTLRKWFPTNGYNAALRQLVANYCKQLEKQEELIRAGQPKDQHPKAITLNLDALHKE